MTYWDELEERLSAPVTERMLELAGLRPGMRVLDLATGKGVPLLRIAEAVGPQGYVLGVDPSAQALQVTRARAAQAGLTNVELQAVGAEAFEVPAASFDAATCRWGLFAVEDPVAALRRVCRALKPGASLVVALWSEAEHISWYSVPRKVTAKFMTLPDRPGPTRLGTSEMIRREFRAAGLQIHTIEELECMVVETENAQDIVGWARAFLARWVPPGQEQAWEESLKAAAEKYRTNGWIRLGGLTRLVMAQPSPSVDLELAKRLPGPRGQIAPHETL